MQVWRQWKMQTPRRSDNPEGGTIQHLVIHWSDVKLLSRVRLFATPWTVAYQAPLSMGFSRQESWSGLPFPSPGDLPNPGLNPGLPHCRQTLYHLSYHWKDPVIIFSFSISKLFSIFPDKAQHFHIDKVPAVHAGAYLSPLSAGICLISMSHWPIQMQKELSLIMA